jgi:hypothetical protein
VQAHDIEDLFQNRVWSTNANSRHATSGNLEPAA